MNRINDYLKEWNISLSDRQLQSFETYHALLAEWNSFMNLTAITEKSEVILKHFVDSLALLHYMDLSKQEYTLIDVGTGAGFPGIPLKIAVPSLQVTLVDSQQKRIRFLNTVIDALKLTGIRTIHSRAEDLGHDEEFREKFDLCTPRALANLTVLSEYCLPFVKTGGYFIPYKSEKTESELKDAAHALLVLGGEVKEVYSYRLPASDLNRSLIMIQKKKGTPSKYPRKAGVPSKEPLK